MDFDNEEEAKISLTPKCMVEVIGVSRWDGQARTAHYPNGFLGSTHYLSAQTSSIRDEWIVQIRAVLECNFANTELVEYKPSKACFDAPHTVNNTQCPKSGVALHPGAVTAVLCVSCGRAFASESMAETGPVLQIGQEDQTKICTDCHSSQCCLVWLKSTIYVHTLILHELTDEVVRHVDRFKASFRLRRRASKGLDDAATLREQQHFNDKEFEELRQMDHEYRREGMLEELDRMEMALDALGNDMQSLLGFLRAPTKGKMGTATRSSSSGHCLSENMISSARLYSLVVRRLLRVADEEPDLLDFYWPQVLQIHLLLAKNRTLNSVALTDMLQQGILSIALRYPHLALKLSWAVLASIGDYADKKITQSQYAACVCILLQLEVATYGVASSLTDTTPPFSMNCSFSSASLVAHSSSNVSEAAGEAPVVRDGRTVLQRLLRSAPHQSQELMIELYTLQRVRRRLISVQDEEMAQRRARAAKAAPTLTPVLDDGSVVCSTEPGTRGTSASGSDTVTVEYDIEKSQREKDCIDEDDGAAKFLQGDGTPATAAKRFTCESIFLNRYNPSEGDKGSSAVWKGLSAQLDFIEKITDLVDYLRFVDRPARTDTLKVELMEKFLNADGTLKMWGLDPTGAAAEPRYRMNRIYVDECRVFRTKARAPSLMVFEVVIDDNEFRVVHHGVVERPHSEVGHLFNKEREHIHTPPLEDTGSGSHHGHHGTTHSHRRGHHHASLVSESDLSSSAENALVPEGVDVSDLLEERLTKTKEDMSRERSLSEAEDLVENGVSGQHEQCDKQGTYDHHKLKHHATSDDIPPISAPAASRAYSSGATRRSSHRNSIPSPPHSASGHGYSQRYSASSPPLIDDDGVDIDPLQADGLPDEDAEVTKRVIASAMALLASGAITQEEYAQLVQSDCKYRDEAMSNHKERARAKIEFYYGEEWATRKERLLEKAAAAAAKEHIATISSSHSTDDAVWSVTEESMRNRSRTRSRSIPDGTGCVSGVVSEETTGDDAPPHHYDIIEVGLGTPLAAGGGRDCGFVDSGVWPIRDLRSFIVKSNDDLRQEVACIQLIELCQEVFSGANLDGVLWLKPYRIVSTGPSAGFVETLPNTLSLDAIKKTEGFESLPKFFEMLYGGSAQTLHVARRNYVSSLAAYSLVCYVFCIKDRHNGNILLDSEGHIVHIDFGFLLGIAPGGSFSVESAPFKLTDEMLDIFGGLESHYFSLFVKAFTTGFLALRSKTSALVSAVEMMAEDSPFPCFQGKDTTQILERLRGRLRNDLSVTDAVEHCLDLITQSYSNLGTKQYDTFQWYTNGIIP